MKLAHYTKYQSLYEALFWGLYALVYTVTNICVVWFDKHRDGITLPLWEISVWEISSHVSLLALIPIIIWSNRRFPLGLKTFSRNLPWHILLTLPFALAHVLIMVGIRKAVYRLQEREYDFGVFGIEFFYEYLKDFRTYASILAAIYLYRFILSRVKGEARYIAESESSEQAAPDRFLIKKLGKEFLVKVEDIDWIESAGNYVTLHVGKSLYPLRETMANIQQQLDKRGFARVHRSAILNLDRVSQIEPFDTGDARALLSNGDSAPVSRRYRAMLKERLNSNL